MVTARTLFSRPPTFYAALSLGIALVTLALKFIAANTSHSMGLFSDAAESLVNVLTAAIAWSALLYAAKPADDEHAYGHQKMAYFASGTEGAMILLAAVWIATQAIGRLWNPAPLQHVEIGLSYALVAALFNAVTAWLLGRSARTHHSIVLEASAAHLWSDVWTTAAVVIALLGYQWLHWQWLDAACALAVSAQIAFSGVRLMKRSFDGLMDRALPDAEVAQIAKVIVQHLPPHATFHALRTRQAGDIHFIDFHLLLPNHTTLHDAHSATILLEQLIEATLANVDVTIHVEPIDDPRAWETR